MKRLAVLTLAATAVGVALLGLAGPAGAHVTVTAPGATRGGSDQEITFRVPVEKDIDTVGLRVALPASTPIASVLVEPVPGWTHTQKTTKLAKPIHTDDGDITEAVSEIDWKAQPGHGLKPGEFGAFTIIAGQLPDASQVVFGALQTYSDGSVVSWNQTAPAGSDVEPENPAPTLQLAVDSSSPSAAATGSASSASSSSSSDTGAVVLAIIALVLAAAAVGLAVVTRARTART